MRGYHIIWSKEEKSLLIQIEKDASLFEDVGLASLNESEKSACIMQYLEFKHPAAQEIVRWLCGEYPFDPECLTD